MRRTILTLTVSLAFGAFALAACSKGPATDGRGASTLETMAGHSKALAKEEQGKKLYTAWCSGCHGAQGRGDGPAAAAMTVKPRNFTREPFKLRSTPSGQPPTKDDVFRTIGRGIAPSGMPSFKFLSEDDRRLLADYVLRLAGLEGKPEPKPAELGSEPSATPESIERGKRIYAEVGCAACHGPEGRGDGPSSATLKDDQGRPIPARDYTKGQYLGGATAADLQMRFRTGMDGAPMPSFADNLTVEQGWDLAHYLLSLRETPPPPPSDPVALGRKVVEEKQCAACHVVQGKGGDVGPSLDVAAAKLRYDWVKNFLKDPVAAGKLYRYMPYRMPDLGLKPEEIEGIVAYMAQIATRPLPEPPPVEAKIDAAKVDQGQLIYFLKCTECHNMGSVIPTPEAKQQGPDLIDVSRRIRFEWIPTWVNNPKAVYPAARMVDTNLTPDEIEAVRSFIWKTSVEAQKK